MKIPTIMKSKFSNSDIDFEATVTHEPILLSLVPLFNSLTTD